MQKITLGEFIYQLRKEKGMTQAELANKIGVTNKAVSKWETNESNPEINNLPILADELGISVDELLNCKINEKANKKNTGKILGFTGEITQENWHYEFISDKVTKKGIPYLHINLGFGMYRANGVIAIGNIAKGLISFGIVAIGLLGIGVVSVALISIACFAFGLICGLGSIAVGIVALGAISIGIVAFGAIAIGYVSFGALSIGVHAYTTETGKGYGKTIHIITYISSLIRMV